MLNSQTFINVELGKLNDFSDKLLGCNILADKAKYISDSLYMKLSECKSNEEKLLCFDQVFMISDILLDYIFQLYKQLSDLKTEYNELLNVSKKTVINTGGNNEDVSEN